MGSKTFNEQFIGVCVEYLTFYKAVDTSYVFIFCDIANKIIGTRLIRRQFAFIP